MLGNSESTCCYNNTLLLGNETELPSTKPDLAEYLFCDIFQHLSNQGDLEKKKTTNIPEIFIGHYFLKWSRCLRLWSADPLYTPKHITFNQVCTFIAAVLLNTGTATSDLGWTKSPDSEVCTYALSYSIS